MEPIRAKGARLRGRVRGRGGAALPNVSDDERGRIKKGSRQVRFAPDGDETTESASFRSAPGQNGNQQTSSPAGSSKVASAMASRSSNSSRGSSSVRRNTQNMPKTTPTITNAAVRTNVELNGQSFQQRYQRLKVSREMERAAAIKNGFLADPDKPRTLAEAITPRGTCQDMCPEFERVERTVQNDVWGSELDPESSQINQSSSRQIPDEARMVKKFRRAAAGMDEQLPSDLRPPVVLQKTVNYLFDIVIGQSPSLASVHHFVWDRTRAIRNDFSIQQISKASELRIAIDCYERIARFHILSLHQLALPQKPYDKYDSQQEREQLDKTLLSLIQYYDDSRGKIKSPNEAEFRAYCVIFQIQDPIPDLEDRMQTWPREIMLNNRIQRALKLYAAACNTEDSQGPLKPRASHPIAQANWKRFWSLIESNEISYLMACVAEIYFGLVRKTALNSIWHAYRPSGNTKASDWTLAELCSVLGFDGEEEVVDFCEGFGFTISEGADSKNTLDLHSVQGRHLPDPQISVSRQTRSDLVEGKRHGRTFPAVISGLSVRAAREADMIEDTPIDEVMDHEDSMFVPESSKTQQLSSTSGEKQTQSLAQLNTTSEPSSSTFTSSNAPSTLNSFAIKSAPQEVSLSKPVISQFGEQAPATFPRMNGVFPEVSPQNTTSNTENTTTNSVFDAIPKASPIIFNAYSTNQPGNSSITAKNPVFQTNPSINEGQNQPRSSAIESQPQSIFSFKEFSRPPEVTFPPSQSAAASSTPTSSSSYGLDQRATKGNEHQNSSSPIFSFQAPKSSPNSSVSAPSQRRLSSFGPEIFHSATNKSEKAASGLNPGLNATKQATFSHQPSSSATAQTTREPSIVFSATVTPSQTSSKELKSTSHSQLQGSALSGTPQSPEASPSADEIAAKETKKSKVLDQLAETLLCEPYGLLDHFIEFAAGPVIIAAMQQVEMEELYSRADVFRHNTLANRYGRRWRDICWKQRLQRRGRERRKRHARNAEARAQHSPETSIINELHSYREDTGSRSSSVCSQNEAAQVIPVPTEQQKTSRVQIVEPSFTAFSKSSPSQARTENGTAWLEDASYRHRKALHRRTQSHVTPSELERTSASHLYQKAPLNRYSSSVTGRQEFSTPTRRIDTTRSLYFKMKAMGLDPDAGNVSTRSFGIKTDLKRHRSIESDLRSKPDAKRLQANAALSSTTLHRIRQSRLYAAQQLYEQHKQKLNGSSKTPERATNGQKALSPEQAEDDRIFAAAQSTRQALSDSISFFQEEVARDQKEQHLRTPHRDNEMSLSNSYISSIADGTSNSRGGGGPLKYRNRISKFIPRESYPQVLLTRRAELRDTPAMSKLSTDHSESQVDQHGASSDMYRKTAILPTNRPFTSSLLRRPPTPADQVTASIQQAATDQLASVDTNTNEDDDEDGGARSTIKDHPMVDKVVYETVNGIVDGSLEAEEEEGDTEEDEGETRSSYSSASRNDDHGQEGYEDEEYEDDEMKDDQNDKSMEDFETNGQRYPQRGASSESGSQWGGKGGTSMEDAIEL